MIKYLLTIAILLSTGPAFADLGSGAFRPSSPPPQPTPAALPAEAVSVQAHDDSSSKILDQLKEIKDEQAAQAKRVQLSAIAPPSPYRYAVDNSSTRVHDIDLESAKKIAQAHGKPLLWIWDDGTGDPDSILRSQMDDVVCVRLNANLYPATTLRAWEVGGLPSYVVSTPGHTMHKVVSCGRVDSSELSLKLADARRWVESLPVSYLLPPTNSTYSDSYIQNYDNSRIVQSDGTVVIYDRPIYATRCSGGCSNCPMGNCSFPGQCGMDGCGGGGYSGGYVLGGGRSGGACGGGGCSSCGGGGCSGGSCGGGGCSGGSCGGRRFF